MTAPPNSRCGIDTVKVERVERFLQSHPEEKLRELFSEEELGKLQEGKAGGIQSLAGRFAAKEACCKLFPKELASGCIGEADFKVSNDAYGAPHVVLSERAQAFLDRYLLDPITISITHTKTDATAVAIANPRKIRVPLSGRVMYRFFPWKRGRIVDGLRVVFGDYVEEERIDELAKACYGHYFSCLKEILTLPFMTRKQKKQIIRVENSEALVAARAKGKGVLLLTGHFGNWEVSTIVGMGQFKEYRGVFHFVRRALKPKFFNDMITRRFSKAGLGTLPKRGSMDKILDLLEKNSVVVIVFDQNSGPKLGVTSQFFGKDVWSFKNLAVLSQTTGAPVVPASSWREEDGSHVLRFHEALDWAEDESYKKEIQDNTNLYNKTLEGFILKHPEQWIWMHQRWKYGK